MTKVALDNGHHRAAFVLALSRHEMKKCDGIASSLNKGAISMARHEIGGSKRGKSK